MGMAVFETGRAGAAGGFGARPMMKRLSHFCNSSGMATHRRSKYAA